MRFVEWSKVLDEFQKPYSYFKTSTGANEYIMEITPIGDFLMCTTNAFLSSFKRKLKPCSPRALNDAYAFFSAVYDMYRSEAALQLIYMPADDTFFWYVPMQRVAPATVTFSRYEGEGYIVADLHSHGGFSAFFSSVDNRDEKGTSLFGVIGNINTNKPTTVWRAGCHGTFKNLDDLHCLFGKGNAGYIDLDIDEAMKCVHTF